MVETIVYEIWAAGHFDEIIHHGKLSFEKVLTRVNLACINLPVVNIHLESDRDAGRAPPFRSAYRTRRSLLFLRFFSDSLTREAGGATRPTPMAPCRPAHSPDVALNLFIRKANGLCSTRLACHFATLLRAIRSTDKERRSIERRSCVKNLALRLGCIGALHPSAVLGLSASAAMKNLRFDRDWVLCPRRDTGSTHNRGWGSLPNRVWNRACDSTRGSTWAILAQSRMGLMLPIAHGSRPPTAIHASCSHDVRHFMLKLCWDSML